MQHRHWLAILGAMGKSASRCNQAYALTPVEIELTWLTSLPRMAIPPPTTGLCVHAWFDVLTANASTPQRGLSQLVAYYTST